MSRTFSIDILADTTYSCILDRSMATIDVEQGTLKEQCAATQKSETKNASAEAARWPAAGESGTSREAYLATGSSGLSDSVGVFLEWVAVRHVVCGAVADAPCSSVCVVEQELESLTSSACKSQRPHVKQVVHAY
jgi:hypothetical protein